MEHRRRVSVDRCWRTAHPLRGRALATSLAVSAALALPGTVTHWALGHIDWRVVAAYTVLAVPSAYLGARLAIRAKPGWLTRIYGVALALLASGLLLFGT
ncbi:MAG: sulfite exporter TauE/SafE family protein [Micromonospora sp.]